MSFDSGRPCKAGLLACARPGPSLGGVDQARFYWVSFHVMDDAIQFVCVADAMVIGFVKPEWCARSSKQEIGFPGRRAFDPSHNLRKWAKRAYDQMDMVRHDRPGEPFIQPVFVFSAFKNICDYFGDPRIAEPSRSCCRFVQQTVCLDECASGFGVLRYWHSASRHRPEQPPGYKEDRFGRIVVRQISSVVRHGQNAGQKACFTSGVVQTGFSR